MKSLVHIKIGVGDFTYIGVCCFTLVQVAYISVDNFALVYMDLYWCRWVNNGVDIFTLV